MAHLQVGQMANRVVKDVLDTGAGNQVVDVAASGGESWARLRLGDELAPHGNMQAQLQRAKYSQGGNCPVHASLAAAILLRMGSEPETEINAPVVRVWEARELDHTYTMIGDPRDRTWGDKNTVVVDPWPVVPSAMTLSEAKLHDARKDTWTPFRPNDGMIVNTFAPGSSEWHRMADNATVIQPMTSERVEERLSRSKAMRKQPALSLGDKLAVHAFRVDKDSMWDSRLSTNPATVYTDGTRSQTFDEVSSSTVEHLREGIAALRRINND
ncbi:hypothetical protein [Xanthomonas hortorum]|uniref:hypothetical protein n=1 Tax=Xanthomonas hortorum TaxID=56454 RepID=UPI001593CF79|nr:hypothetical protein [Xanthomonas hortorum]NHF66059.1 hypothetical protein [Xanthomonas hortorum]